MASSASTWAEVSKGDRVELKGKVYVVTKIKAKGKRARVTVVGGGGRFEAEVKLKDAVTIAPAAKAARRSPLHDEWYEPKTKAERKELKLGGLPPGDASQTKPPKKAKGGAWDEPAGKVEKRLDAMLGAHLVAETDDESAGYYVPPVDASTVAAHWMLYHEGDDWQDVGETELLKRHERDHLPGDDLPLKVNHWHTKVRP